MAAKRGTQAKRIHSIGGKKRLSLSTLLFTPQKRCSYALYIQGASLCPVCVVCFEYIFLTFLKRLQAHSPGDYPMSGHCKGVCTSSTRVCALVRASTKDIRER